MKKNLLFAAFVLIASTNNLFAIPHSLKDNGLVAGLTQVYTTTENRDDLAPVIKKYYERVQQGQYDISIEDLQVLYDEVCAILSQGNRNQI